MKKIASGVQRQNTLRLHATCRPREKFFKPFFFLSLSLSSFVPALCPNLHTARREDSLSLSLALRREDSAVSQSQTASESITMRNSLLLLHVRPCLSVRPSVSLVSTWLLLLLLRLLSLSATPLRHFCWR